MATYTIELPDGRHLDVQANDAKSAMAGAQQWAAQNVQQPKSLLDAVGTRGQGVTQPDNSIIGQGARGVVGAGLSGAQHIVDAIAPPGSGAGNYLGRAVSSLTQGHGLPSYAPSVGKNTLSADVAGLANLLSREGTAHSPWQLPQVDTSGVGPSTGEMAGSVPWLRDQPTNFQGRSARIVGGIAPFGIAGAQQGAAPALASVAGPSLGAIGAGEGARALGGSPDDVSLAQLGGGVAGGMAAGTFFGAPKGSDRILSNKTPSMSPQQMADAVESLKTGRDIGLQPTLTESIDANVPGAQTTVTQRSVEGTPEGVRMLGPRMAARPDQMQAVMADVLDRISPPRDPVDTAMGAQQGAEATINDARAGVNAQARPSYDSLSTQEMPRAEYRALMDDPSFAKASKAFWDNPELSAPYKDLPNNSLAVVNEIVKTLRDMKEQVEPNPANPEGSRQLSSVRGSAMDRANALASAISPDYANARQIVAQGHQDVIDPMAAGPLGAIAKPEGMSQPNLSSQVGALFPNKPFAGQPQITADALQDVGRSGRNVGADLTRAYMERQMAESAQRIAGKPNTFAPSNFSTNVAGNPIQRANLLGATDAVAPQATEPLARALDTFDVTGMRRGEGSATADNLGQQADIASGGKVAIAEAARASPRMILDRLSNWYDTLRIEGNQKDLVAAVNADPEKAMAILQRIEAARGNTALQRALIGSLKGAAGAQTQGQTP